VGYKTSLLANDRLYAGSINDGMNAVIRERVKIDQEGTVIVSDGRLHRGDEVEVIVRPARGSKFLQTARNLSIDAPADFSLSYEDSLHPRP
jgi:hypothetical protein